MDRVVGFAQFNPPYDDTRFFGTSYLRMTNERGLPALRLPRLSFESLAMTISYRLVDGSNRVDFFKIQCYHILQCPRISFKIFKRNDTITSRYEPSVNKEYKYAATTEWYKQPWITVMIPVIILLVYESIII